MDETPVPMSTVNAGGHPCTVTACRFVCVCASGVVWVEGQLKRDRYLAAHARYYIREMRIKAYSQLLESYRSLSLQHMAKTFGVSEAFIDR